MIKNHIVSSLLLIQQEGKLSQYPRHYVFHYNINKQVLNVS